MDWYHPLLGFLSASSTFKLNGETYPRNWLRTAPSEVRNALGFLPVQPGEVKDENYFVLQGENPTVLNGVPTLVRTYVSRPLGEIKAKKVQDAKQAAASLLQPTDWQVIRQAEGGSPIDITTRGYRVAVRTASNDYEALVNACGTVEKLMTLAPPSWPSVGAAPDA